MFQNLKKSSAKNKRHAFGFLFLAAEILLLFSCGLSKTFQPEFTVSTPVYKSSLEDSTCKTGGVYFDFYNKAESEVVFMEIRMNVYDKKSGLMAFIGTGTIVSSYSVSVSPGETKSLCVSLDPYITVRAEEGYYIDQFYISRIKYSDGRVWSDNLGVYATSGRGQ